MAAFMERKRHGLSKNIVIGFLGFAVLLFGCLGVQRSSELRTPVVGYARGAALCSPSKVLKALWRFPKAPKPDSEKEKRYAMNVVVTEKTIAMAADEVTPSGDRLPLTNFQSWPMEIDEDEIERMTRFECLLDNRTLPDLKRKELMDQARDILRVLRDKSPRKAAKKLSEEMEDILIRDLSDLRRSVLPKSDLNVRMGDEIDLVT
eukprot:CAMPEP_0167758380 /NCGR_PEP_ID=MMETSP0110_2-20121227/10436_1 /TAXON_ID=629695 /ORGANISM="Gymnochlora sp., Strain CCMP2014" /LENGTH=204 /DNA_ID=CAMNT_0007644649 /DNA_START=26 /DNA_END=643 /DNA_ORIENTATION=-